MPNDLLVADGFDSLGLGTVDLGRRYRVLGGAGVVPDGRRGTNGLAMGGTLEVPLMGASSVMMGAALYGRGNNASRLGINPVLPYGDPVGSPIWTYWGEVWEIVETDTGPVITVHYIPYITLGVFSDGALRVSRGAYPYVATSGDNSNASAAATQLSNTAPNTIRFSSWQHIEMHISFDEENGAVYVWVEDELVINQPDVPTIPKPWLGYVAQPASPYVHVSGGSVEGVIDDLYVLRREPNLGARIGDLAVEKLFPNGAGFAADATLLAKPTAPGSHWASARDTIAAGVTTGEGSSSALQFDAAGERESYAFDDLAATGQAVLGVQVNALCNRTEGLARVRLTNRIAGVDVKSDVLEPPLVDTDGQEYNYVRAALGESADGEWSQAKVQASEFGFERAV